MLKFFVKGSPPIVGMGLTEANLELLKQNKPISFNLSEDGFPVEGRVIVAYDSPELREVIDQLRKLPKTYIFVLNDTIYQAFKNDKAISVQMGDIVFHVVYGETLEALYEKYKDKIGPQTRCVNKGLSPSDKIQYGSNN